MSRDYSYIIIDNEPHAIQLLSNTIARYYDHLHMAGAYTTWDTALKALIKNDTDLVFMDISIPHTNGMMLLEMAPAQKGEIVFVTAHEEHALKAYEYAPSGYILKPIADDKLIAAVDKALERLINNQQAIALKNTTINSSEVTKIGIPNSNGIDYVDMEDIIYFESATRYTKVITRKEKILSSHSISKFNELLSGLPFYQVHRSFIVNLKHVQRYIGTGIILMTSGGEIPVSRNHRDEFFEMISKMTRA